MTDVTLSICIPTYNRAAFLDYSLSNLAAARFPFPIEIVISDNASTDETPAVVKKHVEAGVPISYYRQTTNKGSTSNYLSVYRRARGKFAMYLADDDLVIPDSVAQAVEFLKAHPSVQAAYSPWVLFDDVKKVEAGQFYKVDEDCIFSPGQDAHLLKYVVDRHVFPEIVIYRSSAIRGLIAQGNFCFQFFVDFAHVFARGPIAFLAKPFYRSVTISPLRTGEIQSGIDHVMNRWDDYRGGLEYFVYRCLSRAGMIASDRDSKQIRQAIDQFLDVRMSVAQRLWLARGDYARGYEILCRRRFYNPDLVAGEADRIGSLKKLVQIQTMARLTNAIVGVDHLLVPESSAKALEPALRHCGLEERIAVKGIPAQPTEQDRESSIVLLEDETSRQKYIDQGYAHGLLVSQADLAAVL